MKKILYIFAALLCSAGLKTHAQIPNAGFESWTSGDPDGWATSNIFPAGIVDVTQTSDAHSGASALRGDVINFMGTNMAPIIQSGSLGRGFPISQRYLSFELYYKFTSVGSDKFSVNVAFTKAGSPIAQGIAALPATVTSYTHLTVPMNYTTNDVPDTAIIQLSITGPVTGIDYHIGSFMIIDDLSFSFSTGLENLSGTDKAMACYPNPSSDIINIPLNKNVSGETILKVFDTFGKEMKNITLGKQTGGGVFQFSVRALSPGVYVYSLHGENKQYHGKFTVTR